jgi:rifampicin phosphotransferase
MSSLVYVPGVQPSSVDSVGGKAYSLIRMIKAGLPVPNCVVLTTDFFAPWIEEIFASKTWALLTVAKSAQWAPLCNDLKIHCQTLAFNLTQEQAFAQLQAQFKTQKPKALFAVRSSSPEEDLGTASFAGEYETRLGVPKHELENAVRHCFASCFDERVLVYKHQRGLDILLPRIAVIVQQQIDSDVAGVGFSLNPITNDYDEALIEANWGQGESVVSGLTTPDSFVMDKVDRQLVEKTLGAKQVSIRLNDGGGTEQHQGRRVDEFSLSENQLTELTETICRIETLYQQPMDIEWAYEQGRLYLLQARPITTYVPLVPEMLTKPGQRRRLYADAALSKGMTINAAMSPMESDSGQSYLKSVLNNILGVDLSVERGLVFYAGGRLYINLSNMMWLSSLKKMSKANELNDILMAKILANVDEKKYRASTRPPWMRFVMLWRIAKLLWLSRRCFWNLLLAIISPERTCAKHQQKAKTYEFAFNNDIDYGLSFAEFRRTYTVQMVRQLLDTLGVLTAGLVALACVSRIVGKKPIGNSALAEKLQFGFEGNVVVNMGISLFHLAKQLSPSDFKDLEQLSKRIESREMSTQFQAAWDKFVALYGWRGPLEMDVASPRYADCPYQAIRQMSFMAVDDNDFNPQTGHQRNVEERRNAYRYLMSRISGIRRVLLRRAHNIVERFVGTRDTPKHHVVLFNYVLRKKALMEGQRLVTLGRLDSPNDIFALTANDIEQADRDDSLDLRDIREKRMRFNRILEVQVKVFPQVIDSRGRILRPAVDQDKPGELTGMAVSPGVVVGPVKVLNTPYEKPINKGDILVAYTTDPGWTPLFVNAAAVVLEVGGALQHGAVVAREYGKPCVVGIDRVASKLQDGQQVEVNGTTGVIRRLP